MDYRALAFFRPALAVCAAALFLFACNDDGPVEDPVRNTRPFVEAREISTPDDAFFAPGDRVMYALNVRKGFEGELMDAFKVEFRQHNAPWQTAQAWNVTETDSFAWDTTFFARADLHGETPDTNVVVTEWRFVILDQAGLTDTFSTSYLVLGDEEFKAPEPDSVTAFFNDTLRHFSLLDDRVYADSAAGELPEAINFSYFWDQNTQNNLLSPLRLTDAETFGDFAVEWGQLSCEFRKTDWDATAFDTLARADRILEAYRSGQPTETPESSDGTHFNTVGGDFVRGRVIAFKTENVEYGLIKIVETSDNGLERAELEMKLLR